MDDEARKDVLGEALMAELKAIRELVADVPANFAEVRRDLAELKDGQRTAAMVAQDHEDRITALER